MPCLVAIHVRPALFWREIEEEWMARGRQEMREELEGEDREETGLDVLKRLVYVVTRLLYMWPSTEAWST